MLDLRGEQHTFLCPFLGRFFKTPVAVDQSTWPNIPEELNLYQHRCPNLVILISVCSPKNDGNEGEGEGRKYE